MSNEALFQAAQDEVVLRLLLEQKQVQYALKDILWRKENLCQAGDTVYTDNGFDCIERKVLETHDDFTMTVADLNGECRERISSWNRAPYRCA